MPSQARTLELWNNLEPDGGTRQAVIPYCSKLVETNREDGTDSLVATFPLSLPICSSITATTASTRGWAARICGEDGTLREYLVYIIEDDINADTCTITCTSPIAILGLVAVPDATLAAGTLTSLVGSSQGLGAVGGPAWATTLGTMASGTFGPISTSGDTILSFLNKCVAAVDATLSSGAPPCVMSFTPTIVSGVITAYTCSIVTTVATGTAILMWNKNIAKFLRRRDATDPTLPLTGYQLLIDDLYRNTPAAFPDDNLKPYQTCRLVWPPLGIDTTIRIVSVVTDHNVAIGTTIELGTPKKRVAQTVATVTAAVAPIVDPTGPTTIPYESLSLTGKIVNTDVSAAAAIAGSKIDATTIAAATIPDSALASGVSTTGDPLYIVKLDHFGNIYPQNVIADSHGFIHAGRFGSIGGSGVDYKLPTAFGSPGQTLHDDGAGNLYWA